MKTSKSDRQIIFNKFGGKCAYCGSELQKGWHVDEVEPCRRNFKYDSEKGKNLFDGTYMHPERLVIENQFPACGSCNRMKSSHSLEGFRHTISQFLNSLNNYSTQYKFAKRYGQVKETIAPIVFYFETIQLTPTDKEI